MGDLRERYLQSSNDELLDVCVYKRGDYSDEARAIAAEILAERGVDLEAEKRALVARVDADLQARDGARAAHEAKVEEVAAAGRATGQCLKCRAQPPAREITLFVMKTLSAVERTPDSGFIRELPLPIPLCDACARLHPMRGTSLLWGLLAIVLALGGLGVVVGVRREAFGSTGNNLGLGFVALGIVWGFIEFYKWWAQVPGGAGLVRAHPSFAALEADGWRYAPGSPGHRIPSS
jgi:hypothetical protein